MLMKNSKPNIPVGTQALIFSKLYYGVLSKSLEELDIERYFSVLYFLHYNNRCSQQFICNHLAVDKTAMVKVMNYLIKMGYIEREVNPKDKREHFIGLTRTGKKHTKMIVAAFEAIDQAIFSDLAEKEKDIFLGTMAKLSQKLAELPANDIFFNYKLTRKN